MIPILILGVTAEESMPGLYKILDDQVATSLARVSGVGTVSVSGIAQREIQVYCDPNKLEAYGLSIEAISEAIAAANRSTRAVRSTWVLTPTRCVSTRSSTTRRRCSTSSSDTTVRLPIYLRDVARVQDTVQERTQETFNNGEKGRYDRGTEAIGRQLGSRCPGCAEAAEDDHAVAALGCEHLHHRRYVRRTSYRP